MHTTIQKTVQDLLRNMGYIVIVESPFDGRNADILVQNPQTCETTIIEIELHKNYRHAIQSIRSDLDYCSKVIVICGSETILKALVKSTMKYSIRERKRIHFVLTNQCLNFIRTLFQNKNKTETRNRTQNKIETASDFTTSRPDGSRHG